MEPGYLINILLAVALSVLSAAPPAADEPLGPGRRVVILGSSTAAGIGASHYARSWAGRLTSELQLRGYRVFNRSISGNNTRDLLARFDTDVTPLQPEFVVFASSMQNESINTDPRGAYARYTANSALLLEKARRIGASSVVIGQYANNGYSGEAVDVVQRVYEDLERQGIATWDLFGPTADPITGKWLPGLSDDGVHPNDPGDKLIFDSDPPGALSDAAAGPPHRRRWSLLAVGPGPDQYPHARVAGPAGLVLDRGRLGAGNRRSRQGAHWAGR